MFHQNNSAKQVILPDYLGYWKKQLQKVPPILDLTTDGIRTSETSYQTEQETLIFSQKLTESLQQISQQEQVSLEIILLASFQTLLYRYTNQSDLVVSLITRLINNQTVNKPQLLPIRIKFTELLSWRNLLKRVEQKVTEAYDYSDIELEQLQQILIQDGEDRDFLSLTQILFHYQTVNASFAKTAINSETWEQQLRNQDLRLNVIEQNNRLLCNFEYAKDLFEPATIKRIATHYQKLIEAIVRNPDEQIDRLAFLTKPEVEQALFGCNQTQTNLDRRCIHQMLAFHAERNPNAVAIVCQGKRLTYAQLNAKANQLAHYLQSLGVKPESLVGLYAERSLDLVVGLWGILKAGGAYVPLDRANPQERQAFIVNDSQISILLTQEHLLAQVPEQITQVICLDRDWHKISDYPEHDPESQVNQDNLAQIVYTSGSTGKPKGVMLTHQNLSHYAQDLQLALQITTNDVYLHRGSIALVVSARQLLTPLALGATAVITTEEEKREPIKLFELIKREGVTIVDHVPSFWRHFAQLLSHLAPEVRANLLDNQVRLVGAGGEQVTAEILNCWRKLFKPQVKFVNIYGQTEGTGVVTVYYIPDNLDQRLNAIPVGHPIPNMQVYLLDHNLQPLPVGVPAELHISGAGVARGYLHRPELTTEKFIPNPYLPGERLYKTGDLARYLADGSIQFLGRIDRQVNLYGLRIELGEIEAILSQHPNVREAVVMLHENHLGQRLVAYVVPNQAQFSQSQELRSFLQTQLPSYMIPSAFGFLEAFPLTTSGKIDRQALPSIESIQQSSERTYLAPSNQLEQELTQIFEEILNTSPIGIEDNFVELGGNSLLAANLINQIAQKYRQNLPLAAVFQAPTVKQLATLLDQKQTIELPHTIIPIQVGVERPNLFAIHILGYGLEYYRPLAKYLASEVNLYGLSTEFTSDRDIPHPRDINALADYYFRELLAFQPQGPYLLVGVSFGGVVAYEIAQKLVAQGHQVNFLGLFDSYCPHGNRINKPFQKRLIGHLENLRQKRLNYVRERLQDWYYLFRDETQYRFYKAIKGQDYFRGNLSQGIELGAKYERLRNMQLRKEHGQINQNYQIQPYPGQVTLFRATENRDSKLEWHQFAEKGLEIFDIPGTHLGIFQEPQVQVLAKQLKLCLEQII